MGARKGIPWDILTAIIVDSDGTPPCDPPDGCEVCSLLGPLNGEDWAGYLARMGQAFRAASPTPRTPNEPPPAIVCQVCGQPFEAVRKTVTTCSRSCRQRRYRARKRAAA